MLLGRKKKTATPKLADRLLSSGARKIAVVGLHGGAGARTVVTSLAQELSGRDCVVGLTRARRIPCDADSAEHGAVRLPQGSVVATLPPDCTNPALVPLDGGDPPGGVRLYRLAEASEVNVRGPDDSAEMSEALERLADAVPGPVLLEAPWERRSFGAPGVADAMILVTGPTFSGCAERSAAAVRYIVDTLRTPPCDERSGDAWVEAWASGSLVALDDEGRQLGVLPAVCPDPAASLLGLDGGGVTTVALPDGLRDDLLAPLVRSQLRCTLVVRDPTRIRVAPVWLKAWLKKRGSVRVVHPAHPIAVATNPCRPDGPDADADGFRRLVAEAVPDLPVHDVRLESLPAAPRWKIWA